MQYLLSEEEFEKLGPKSEIRNLNLVIEEYRLEIIRLTGYPCRQGYCDECPVVKISKGRLEVQSSFSGLPLNMFCQLEKNFSR